MRREIKLLVALLTAVVISFGCSSGNDIPVTPGEVSAVETSHSSHYNWGIWQFIADPQAETLEAIPLRGVSMHVNVLPFLEPPPLVNLTLESVEFNGNIIEADIGLRHPFLGMTEFTGFDVCGIFITNGSVSGFSDPALVMTGEGDTRLLNPDGLSRWWNPAEFPVNLGTIFSYNDGLLGAPDSFADYNATLNGYKYYADGLGPDDALDTLDPEGRGVFSPGQKNIRHFNIEIGDPGLIFNYAIDANWIFPEGSHPYEIDDFSENANRPEAWRVSTEIVNNTLYNDGSTSGGMLSISIDVYDHFDAGLNTVRMESPGNFDATSSSTPVSGGVGYSTYEIDITDTTPAEGEIEILIAVECEKLDYGGVLPGEPVAAYFMMTAPVSSEQPMPGIYVDGDNGGDPLEDGSASHPFDTIQEGVNAAGVAPFEDIYDIYVDPYDGGGYDLFSMANDVQVIGDAWSGGTGRPELILTGSYTIANGVDNCKLENFLVTFNHTTVTGGQVILFYAVDADNLTIEDCKFTGILMAQTSIFFRFSGCNDLSIEHNEFVNFRNKSNYNGNMLIYFLQIFSSDGAMIRHNEFHDIGFDDEGPNTTYNNTNTYLWYPTSHNVSFLNNLVYNIKDYSDSTPVGYKYNYITIMRLPGGTSPPSNLVVANNTVDDMSEVAMGGTAVGAAKFCYGYNIGSDWTFKNTILSNWNPFSGAENGHRGFWADGSIFCTVTYSNVFNIGPVGHPQVRDYVNRMLRGVGCFGIYDYQDPAYDMTPGDNWYHVTNSLLVSDPTDGGEMGAFGGTYGDWLPPSQE